MSDVVELMRRGNGAREALIGLLHENDLPDVADTILADLWIRGFKVVPLDEENGWHVPTIQRSHFRTWVGRKLWAIIDMPSGSFQVYQQSADGVGPPSEYPTLRKAAARLLQLLGTGAIAPQSWPEEVCVGYVEIRTDEADDGIAKRMGSAERPQNKVPANENSQTKKQS